MKHFPVGHATHPQWPMAAALVLAQLRAQMALPDYAATPTLGLLYITDHYASAAQEILDHLREQLPEVTDWAGTTGVGVASSNVEYFDEPALAVMLCDLPPDQYRVFSGVAPLSPLFPAHTALVHADARTPDLAELIEELAQRTETGYLFGGLAASRSEAVQFAVPRGSQSSQAPAGNGVFSGGLSGVAFGERVSIVSRVTQGCRPIAAQHLITGADGNVVKELDGKPALDVLLDELQVTLDEPEPAITRLRATLAGLTQPGNDLVGRAGTFGADVVVRHIIGLDPKRNAVALAEHVQAGMRLAFCQRNAHAARADLMRICAEIREELESEEFAGARAPASQSSSAESRIAAAVYVSCAGRGGPHFGGPSAELQLVRHALGDVPLVGFFAGGEIAGQHLYGYTGVLTVFR